MANVWRIDPAEREQFDTPPMDGRVAALANRQHGVVAYAQLRELGLSASAIGRRADWGRLHRIHVGVYAVGHAVLTPRGRWMSAVLAVGPGAALSDADAGALWEMRRSAAAVIDVTVRGTAGRSRPGLRVHRRASLRGDDMTTKDGIPVTTPARTLLDLAATLKEREFHRALDQAEIRELTD
jgi:predicted transcriptional regulator of viral defense system